MHVCFPGVRYGSLRRKEGSGHLEGQGDPTDPTRRGEDGTTEDRGCPRKVPYKEPK